MADVHSPEIRSYNMSQIKGKNTKPEVIVREYLFSHGFRYRKNVADLPGKPDIVLRKYKTCIFVNGCFWHMHKGCEYFRWPKNNADFWRAKIYQNAMRDKETIQCLEQLGWNVIVLWECELKPKTKDQTLECLIAYLKNGGENADNTVFQNRH